MRQLKILVADDSATVRTQICRTLSDAGFDVIEASNGLAAIRLAADEPPSVAILDIEMPYMDGFAVCQEIKQMGPPWNTIPIVFLTAARSHALEMLGEQLGAYVQKPISPDELLALVQSLIASPRPEKAAKVGLPRAATVAYQRSGAE
jgi:DNA-binding response OmpR family regulator